MCTNLPSISIQRKKLQCTNNNNNDNDNNDDDVNIYTVIT